MLLQVVADARDIGTDLDTVGKTNSGDLTERGVRLLRCRSLDGGAYAALLRRSLIDRAILLRVPALQKCGSLRFLLRYLSALADQLIKGWHGFPPFKE